MHAWSNSLTLAMCAVLCCAVLRCAVLQLSTVRIQLAGIGVDTQMVGTFCENHDTDRFLSLR